MPGTADLRKVTALIIASYVERNIVSPDDLPALIRSTFVPFRTSARPGPKPLLPKRSVRRFRSVNP